MAKILLVDDNEISLMMTEMVLSEMHYDVTTAANGKEAIALLQREPYDLLMLDIVMEDMSGIETLARIRKIEKISGIRTIFLTSSSHTPDMTEAIRLGALDFIQKPALPEKLYSAIRQALLIEKKDSILAVDDDNIILLAIQSLFGIRYDVRCVSSGAEALAELVKEKPDLVLLDLHMPGMDGLEVMSRLRCIEGCEDLPVVFLTGDNDADTEAKIFAAGAMDFLAKPMVMQVALHRIRRILENRHLQVSLRNEVELKIRAAQESKRRILNFSEQIIHALSGAIDAKDTYNKDHSMRVAAYSRELAHRLGKPAAKLSEIYNIALLHDVGKIGIPNEIINKPDKLTEAEYALIKSHAIKGYDILKPISEMPDLAIGARWHHERYDGKGYPDGKVGEDIPEIARIICVADCYDAMSSDRVYRKALPQRLVRQEIERNMGTQFDPTIAKVMLQMIDEDTEYKMRGNRGE